MIRQFTEEAFIDYCENLSDNPQANARGVETLHDDSLPVSAFSPHNKIVELYERLLQAEREKLAYVKKMLGSKL